MSRIRMARYFSVVFMWCSPIVIFVLSPGLLFSASLYKCIHASRLVDCHRRDIDSAACHCACTDDSDPFRTRIFISEFEMLAKIVRRSVRDQPMSDKLLITLLFVLPFDPFTVGLVTLCGLLALAKKVHGVRI